MEMGLLLSRLHAHYLGPYDPRFLPGAVLHFCLQAGLCVMSCRTAGYVEQLLPVAVSS